MPIVSLVSRIWISVIWLLVVAFSSVWTISNAQTAVPVLQFVSYCLGVSLLSFLALVPGARWFARLTRGLGNLTTLAMVILSTGVAIILAASSAAAGVASIVYLMVSLGLVMGVSLVIVPRLVGKRTALVMVLVTGFIIVLTTYNGLAHLGLGWIAWLGWAIRFVSLVLFFGRWKWNWSPWVSVFAWPLWVLGMIELFALSRFIDYRTFGVTFTGIGP